ncbi:hypothetical protein KEJ37_01285 [Candidatus Bathyarchaeota archaeon]|nr:hypothetical protein [Candidatus Bathyarchaeota archaeon]
MPRRLRNNQVEGSRPDTFDFSDVMSVLLNMSEKIVWDYLMKRAEGEGLAHLISITRRG